MGEAQRDPLGQAGLSHWKTITLSGETIGRLSQYNRYSYVHCNSFELI